MDWQQIWIEFTLVCRAATPFLLAFVAAAMTPVSVVKVRHEIRLRRIRLIDQFSRNFKFGQRHPAPADGAPARGQSNPSFEFVKSKYAVDIDTIPAGIDRERLQALDLSDPKVDDFLSTLGWWGLRSNRRILGASLLYVGAYFFGFLLTIMHVIGIDIQKAIHGYFGAAFPSGTCDGKTVCDRDDVVTIMVVSFLSSYVFTIRTFVRSVSMFDLSAVTMLRAVTHMALSVVMTTVLYLAVPNPLLPVEQLWSIVTGADGQAGADGLSEHGVSGFWLVAALLFGFVPDTVLQFLYRSAGELSKLVKTADMRFQPVSGSVPLEILDGIDFFTRFRLEEANVLEVQNLATANPIMLHIETPYGIYQTIDWVAQAQLCAAVGPERFMLLRQQNVRTIFDLERIVRAQSSTPELRRWIAGVLLMGTDTRRKVLSITGSTLASATPTDIRFDSDAFDARQAETFALNPGFDATLRHLVKVMADDLHVVRLRKIWEDIGVELGADAMALDDDFEFGKDGKPREARPGAPQPPADDARPADPPPAADEPPQAD